MAKLIETILYILVSSLSLLHPTSAYPPPKVTKLHFFLQDTFSGPNASVHPVARSNITSISATSFGLVSVVDDPLTVGPDPKSRALGRAQGIVANADFKESAIHVSLTFVFTSGKFDGSTLTMVGRNELSRKIRQMPIVGGTGAFEFAQGIATTGTYSTNPEIDHSVVEFNITVARTLFL